MEHLFETYKPCGSCGCDHYYEPTEANKWHLKYDKTNILDLPKQDKSLRDDS